MKKIKALLLVTLLIPAIISCTKTSGCHEVGEYSYKGYYQYLNTPVNIRFSNYDSRLKEVDAILVLEQSEDYPIPQHYKPYGNMFDTVGFFKKDIPAKFRTDNEKHVLVSVDSYDYENRYGFYKLKCIEEVE